MPALNDIMEFDHVVEILVDGSVIDRPDLYAPEFFNEELSASEEWELLNGWSGQDRYSGPIMHPSEYIGGRLERWILENPGVYVALVSYSDSEEESEETDADGWAIARLVN